MNYRKILTFLALCFGISWPAWFILRGLDPDPVWIKAILALLYVWGPGLAAIITQAFIFGDSLKKIGYSRKSMSWRDWLLCRLGPLGVFAGTLGIIYVLGNLMHIPGFGKIILTLELNAETAINWVFLQGLEPMSMPLPMDLPKWQVMGLFILLALLLGSTIMAFILRGQELAWRGFLIEELKSKGFLGSNLIIGGIWATWSLPTMMTGAPTGDTIYHSLFLFGYCISISFPLAYLSLQTQTVRSSSVFRGILGILAALIFLMTFDTDLLIGGITGMAGMWIFLILTFLILIYDAKFVDNYRSKQFDD